MATSDGHPADEPPVSVPVRSAETLVAVARLRHLHHQLAQARRVLLAVRATRTSTQDLMTAASGMSDADTGAWRKRIQHVYYAALDAYIKAHMALTGEAAELVSSHSGRAHRLIAQTRLAYRR